MASETETTIDASLDVEHVAGIAIGGVVLGGYAAWMAADVAPRWLVFLVVIAAGGYLLSSRDTTRAKVVYTIYSLALFVAITPIMIVFPDVLSAGTYGRSGAEMAFMIANALLLVLFLLIAGVLAYVAFRVDGGRGVVERVRDRLDGDVP